MAGIDMEEMTTQVPAGYTPIKYRNMIAQFFLMIITLGCYGLYWFYSTATEMAGYEKREEPTVLWTILLFVPLISFYSFYKYCELFERISPEMNRWVLLLLWTFFSPAVWIIVQLKLNKLAEASQVVGA
jgi:hypothetical protein